MRKASRAAEHSRLLAQARSTCVPATCDICVVGGGASGLVCAITAAEAGASVVVVEQNLTCGRTILATGNGRCNFANVLLSPKHYNDSAFVESVCGKRWLDDVLDFWRDCGLRWCLEGERLYPLSRQASSVRNVLLSRAQGAGVVLACGRSVTELYKAHDYKRASFILCWDETTGRVGLSRKSDAAHRASRVTKDKETGPESRPTEAAVPRAEAGVPANTLSASAVVLATGGGATTELATSLGLEIVPVRPVLAPLACEKSPLASLDGRRAHVAATLWHNCRPLIRERGEVLLRDYGLSGIVSFDLSRHVRAHDVITLDLLPDMRASEIRHIVDPREKGTYKDGAWDGLIDPVIATLLTRLVRERWVAPYEPYASQIAHTSKTSDTEAMLSLVKGLPFHVIGIAHPELAQITRGGIATSCLCPSTLAAHKIAGLYACGEAIDVDGECGGFNLAWAWKSGLVAGMSAARACYDQ